MHTYTQCDEDGATIYTIGHYTFFVSALVAATMLTVLTATGAEAKSQNPALAQW